MEMKQYIGVQQRVDFVDAVMTMCEIEGKHRHAIFGFAFRVAAIASFYQDAKPGKLEEIEQDAYGEKFEALQKDPVIAAILRELMDACCKEVRDRREQYMEVYHSIVNPDPLNRIADAVDGVAKDFGGVLNKDSINDMMREIYAQKAAEKTTAHEGAAADFTADE